MPTVRESKRKQEEKEEMVRKRAQSSSKLDEDAHRGAIWRKVCIVTRSDIDWFGIYIFDLTKKSSANFTATSPTIRINSKDFGVAAFCVLGSTLYAFEGFYNDWDPDWDPETKSAYEGSKLAYEYELSSSEASAGGLRLEKSMMHQILPSMFYPKYGSPIATPTPDGQQILLFSTHINFDTPDKCDFELYNPKTCEWKKLPGISRPRQDEEIFWDRFFHGIKVHSFTFIKKSVLLIQTDFGLYSLDFLDGSSWERVSDFHGSGHVPHSGDHFVMIGSEFCLTPFHAYDIDIGDGDGDDDSDDKFERRPFYYPGLTDFRGHGFSEITTCIALLRDDDPHFCILQTGIASDSMRAQLALDVYALDISKRSRRLRNIAHNLPGATIVKTFKFFVENQLPIDRFYPLSFHSIPPPITI